MDSGVNVSQCDGLHSKVYLFDNDLIIGSSNASSNGLSMEGSKIKGWYEANVHTNDAEMLKRLSRWFEKLPCYKITEADLVLAKEAWSHRRYNGHLNIPENGSLLAALKVDPSSFKNVRLYVCAFASWFDKKGDEALEKAQLKFQSGHHRIDAFQDWSELPNSAKLVSFYVGDRGGVEFDNFVEMPNGPLEFEHNKTKLKLCFITGWILVISMNGKRP
ncbi:MAG: hypothetical protein WDN46_13450 [Methylocella sp.]